MARPTLDSLRRRRAAMGDAAIRRASISMGPFPCRHCLGGGCIACAGRGWFSCTCSSCMNISIDDQNEWYLEQLSKARGDVR